jgi:hypothetical protein
MIPKATRFSWPIRGVTISKYFDSDYDSKIEALVGTGSDGSGMGPEGRDMDFTLTASQYNKAIKVLEDSDLKGVITSAENEE